MHSFLTRFLRRKPTIRRAVDWPPLFDWPSKPGEPRFNGPLSRSDGFWTPYLGRLVERDELQRESVRSSHVAQDADLCAFPSPKPAKDGSLPYRPPPPERPNRRDAGPSLEARILALLGPRDQCWTFTAGDFSRLCGRSGYIIFFDDGREPETFITMMN